MLQRMRQRALGGAGFVEGVRRLERARASVREAWRAWLGSARGAGRDAQAFAHLLGGALAACGVPCVCRTMRKRLAVPYSHARTASSRPPFREHAL